MNKYFERLKKARELGYEPKYQKIKAFILGPMIIIAGLMMLYFSIIYLYFYLLQYQEIEVYNSETTLWIGMLVGGLGIFLFGFNALRLRYFSSESYKILGISISIITVASFMHKQSFDGAFGLMLPIGFCIYEYYQTKKRGL